MTAQPISLVATNLFPTVNTAISEAQVASFFDPDTTDAASNFTAVINWGDGTVSSATIQGGTGGVFKVIASRDPGYAASGNFTFEAQVTRTATNQQASATGQADVSAVPPSLTLLGGLAQIPGNGPGAASGYTDTNRPIFSGTAPPFSTVELFARPTTYDVNEPLGLAVVSASGQWNLPTCPLNDGIYTVSATVTPPGGYPSSMQPLANNGRMIIDTAAPKVVGISNSGPGQVTVYFRDDLSGMSFASLSSASNYAFAGTRNAGFSPTHATVVAAGSLPTDVVGVTLTIPGNHRAWAMVRGLRITGTNPVGGAGGTNVGITDNAGNPLQGFYGNLVSSASGRVGGNYHVKIRVPVFHGKRH